MRWCPVMTEAADLSPEKRSVFLERVSAMLNMRGRRFTDADLIEIAALARAGFRNVTGIFTAGGSDALTGKRLALLREVVPSVSRIGVMIAADDATETNVLRQLSAATSSLGLTYKTFEVGTSADLESAFAEAVRDGLQGLFISQNPLFFSPRKSRHSQPGPNCQQYTSFANSPRWAA